MNRIRYIYSVLITALSFVQAADSFYPLRIGNVWRYQSVLVEYIDGKLDTISIKTVSNEVLGDTLMSNGKRYFNIKGLDPGFRRFDSLQSRIYEYNIGGIPDSISEYLLFDFSITDSISWIDGRDNHISIRTSNHDERVGHLNETALEKSFQGAYLYPERRFSFGYGLSYFTYGCMLPMSQNTLIYAKVDGKEYSSISAVKKYRVHPNEFVVDDIYPNPFNESAQLAITLRNSSEVSINVYNSIGQKVMCIFDGYLIQGIHRFSWPSQNFLSGLYFVKFEIGGSIIFKKCILVK